MRLTLIALILAAGHALPAQSQHAHHEQSPYAGQQQSHIASLTMSEVEQLESGAGMGMAKPAELNHYPGPKHVLELADSLGLTEDQRLKIEAIRTAMSEEAKRLGREYLHAEHELNRLFSERMASEESVRAQTSRVGEIQSALRSAHLVAHVETAAVLSVEQIERYDRLRGYGTASSSGHD